MCQMEIIILRINVCDVVRRFNQTVDGKTPAVTMRRSPEGAKVVHLSPPPGFDILRSTVLAPGDK
jgi:hypothetical protein